jgi:hypothetical protein
MLSCETNSALRAIPAVAAPQQKLHLGDMGFKLRDKWQKQEELLFALGM